MAKHDFDLVVAGGEPGLAAALHRASHSITWSYHRTGGHFSEVAVLPTPVNGNDVIALTPHAFGLTVCLKDGSVLTWLRHGSDVPIWESRGNLHEVAR